MSSLLSFVWWFRCFPPPEPLLRLISSLSLCSSGVAVEVFMMRPCVLPLPCFCFTVYVYVVVQLPSYTTPTISTSLPPCLFTVPPLPFLVSSRCLPFLLVSVWRLSSLPPLLCCFPPTAHLQYFLPFLLVSVRYLYCPSSSLHIPFLMSLLCLPFLLVSLLCPPLPPCLSLLCPPFLHASVRSLPFFPCLSTVPRSHCPTSPWTSYKILTWSRRYTSPEPRSSATLPSLCA